MLSRRNRRDPEARMTLLGHLQELRKRFTRGIIAILIGAVIGWLLVDPLWEFLRAPITELAESRNASINYSNLTTAFDLRMLVALIAGVVISSPFWLYQTFAFVMPAMSRREKRYVFGFMGSAVPLFLAGCVAGWMVMPNIVAVLTSFVPPDDSAIIEARVYVMFVLKLIVAVGIAFTMPVFLVLLNLAEVLSAESILKSWRVAIMLIMAFSALATPAADVLSMFLLAVPVVGLYFLAAAIAWFVDRRRARRRDREAASLEHAPSA